MTLEKNECDNCFAYKIRETDGYMCPCQNKKKRKREDDEMIHTKKIKNIVKLKRKLEPTYMESCTIKKNKIR